MKLPALLRCRTGLGPWRRSLAAVPLVLGTMAFVQATQYLLLTVLPAPAYHVVTVLLQTAVVLALLYLSWGWQDQAVTTRQAYERLADLERQRDNMTAMLVHDLRNPLTAVGGALGLLLAHPVAAQLSEEHRRFLSMAVASHRRLARMIEDIVDVARGESGDLPLHFTPVSLDDLVRAAVADVRSDAAAKDLVLHMECVAGPAVHADVEKLRRALDNLLSNALRFSPPGSAITVGVTPGDGEMLLSVEAPGAPIPPEMAERILQRPQPHGTERKLTVGMSLPFCRVIAAAHGGRCYVEPAGPAANRFVIALPADLPASSARPRGEASPDAAVLGTATKTACPVCPTLH